MASLIEEALDGIEKLVAMARESLAPKQYVPNGVTTTPEASVVSEVQAPAVDEPAPATEPEPAPVEETPAEGPASDPSGPAAGDVPEPVEPAAS